MKIAFNAIRVSNKAGSGFDTFIINFVNEFARYVSENKLDIKFDVYTLYPKHFPEVKQENIKQIRIPFVKIRSKKEKFKIKDAKEKKENKSKSLYFTFLIFNFLADYFRMVWSQIIFPFIGINYDLIINLTQLEASVFNLNKQVVIVHDLIPYIFRQHKHKHKFFVYRILPYILKKMKLIVAVSLCTKMDLMKILHIEGHKIKVIYEAVDKNVEFYSKQNIDAVEKLFFDNLKIKKFILFVGSNDKRKNLLNVLKSFDIVCEKISDLNLLVVGLSTKKDLDVYQNSILNLDKIKFLGHIDVKDMVILYKNALAFIFPTLYEGFGLPPLEAMSCGCPVVVSDRGSLPEVCGDAAVYVDPYDIKSIADGIIKVLNNKNLRQELINKGFKQVKKFSWEKSVKQFLELLIK
jgi:glycosyltransferase involved in cell wall biosynthesis